MTEFKLFGATCADMLTIMNPNSSTGFTIEDVGGEEALGEIMIQAEAWVLDALPDESARTLTEIDDEVLCRRATGSETGFLLGGLGGIPYIATESVRVFRFSGSDAEAFFSAARAMSRQRYLAATADYELTAGEDFSVSQDGDTHMTTVTLGGSLNPADEGDAFVAGYKINVNVGFTETGLKRLLIAKAASDLARRLGLAEDFSSFKEEAMGLMETYARLERLPWSRKKLDLVRDRTVRSDAVRSRIAVGRCGRR